MSDEVAEAPKAWMDRAGNVWVQDPYRRKPFDLAYIDWSAAGGPVAMCDERLPEGAVPLVKSSAAGPIVAWIDDDGHVWVPKPGHPEGTPASHCYIQWYETFAPELIDFKTMPSTASPLVWLGAS